MYQIDDPTNTTTYPTPPATTGLTPGYFTGGNPATATPGTRVRFWWLNQVQQELMNFLTTAGLTPSKSTNTQVLAACQVMFSKPNFVLLTAASGNYTFPAWCSAFKARIWGAGGGGGGASGTGSIGSGGGGGGYAECNFPVTGGINRCFHGRPGWHRRGVSAQTAPRAAAHHSEPISMALAAGPVSAPPAPSPPRPAQVAVDRFSVPTRR